MKKAILFVMGAMIMMPSAAFAAEDTAPASEAPKQDPGEKFVCKTEKMTGSRTRTKRICMKRSEWDRLANDTANEINKLGRESNRQDRLAGN